MHIQNNPKHTLPQNKTTQYLPWTHSCAKHNIKGMLNKNESKYNTKQLDQAHEYSKYHSLAKHS